MFEIGQRVRCRQGIGDFIVTGQLYTICGIETETTESGVEYDWIGLSEVENGVIRWNPARFEAIQNLENPMT